MDIKTIVFLCVELLNAVPVLACCSDGDCATFNSCLAFSCSGGSCDPAVNDPGSCLVVDVCGACSFCNYLGACEPTGACVPAPGPACASNGSCSASIPSCGTSVSGVDNCGNVCTVTGPICAVPPPPTPPPATPPVVPSCAPSSLCGTVYARENPVLPLRYMVLELRDNLGRLIRESHTDGFGNYAFNGLSGFYFVAPVLDRTWNAFPGQAYLSDSDRKDFLVGGVPVTLTVSGKPGSFVLLTKVPITTPTPPAVPSNIATYSSTVDTNNVATLKVPGGVLYYVTCWVSKPEGWVKTASVAVPGTPANPQTLLSTMCPAS